ncbi:MAG: cobalt ECF transporter T component CbiQ [Desulfovibrionaceae bacterium]|nr:cobalt ECF transporter T component CbiQ [Desulfovibrionaceae bacterium]
MNKTDPRVLVLASIVLATETALLSHFLPLLPMAICASVLFLLNKDKTCLFQRLRAVMLTVCFLWLFTPWSTPGTPVANIAVFTITQEGLTLSLLITFKAAIITVIVQTLLGSLDPATFGHTLRNLKVSEKLVFLLLFARRSFPILAAEWKTCLESARLRAFEPKTSLHTYKTLAALLGILLIKSMDHAQRSHEALLLRGFQGSFIAHRPIKTKPQDILLSVLFLLPALASLLLAQAPH